MLRFGGFLAINNIMNYAARNVDNIAIGWMWGAGALGIYSRAYSLLLLPISQVSAPMLNVAMPAFSRLHDDPVRFRQGYLYLLRVTGLMLVPPVAVLIACADDVVVLLLGDRWTEVAAIYRWLGLIALVQPMTVTCGIIFLSSGCSKELARVTLINSCLTVVSIMVALPYGPAAVAASYSVSGVIIRTPILIHATAQVTAVTARDMYAAVVPQFLLGCVIAISASYSLHEIETSQHWLRIATSAAVGATLSVLWLIASRSQRASLRSIVALVAAGSRRAEAPH
jgi:PST family polysaccharide transporter